MLTSPRRSCRGAAMLEFHIVALFAALPLCLGTLQTGLLLAENHHVDHAAFHAARIAAMTNGDLSAARRGFAQAISVLFVRSSESPDASTVATHVAAAYSAALADQALHARVRVLTPDHAAQSDFTIERDGRRVIPNDGLQYRSSTPGSRSNLSLQQANMLRLEFVYCRPLVVPIARQLLLGTLRVLDEDPWHQSCYRNGRVPIKSQGISPMQSDFRVSS